MRSGRKAALAASVFVLVSTQTVFADGWIAGVRGGALTDLELTQSHFLVGVTGGYDFADDNRGVPGNWRLQGEFTYTELVDFENAYFYTPPDVKYYSLSVALYREFDTGSNYRPYIVAGLGGTYARIRYSYSSWYSSWTTVDDDQLLSIPVGIGVSHDLNEDLSIDVDYRVNVYQTNGSDSDIAETSEISAYLRYSFGGN